MTRSIHLDELVFTDLMTVRTTRVEGTDMDVCLAAWVSTLGDELERKGLWSDEDGDRTTPERQRKLIGFLMRGRHGTPFEQCGFQFLTSAPIFVWRQHFKHRIASYNEESARYRRLQPKFYLPPEHRPLVQVGRPGEYRLEPGTPQQVRSFRERTVRNAKRSWQEYADALADGVAMELARINLPFNVYSTAYFRVNLRSLMNFLSLRVRSDDALFPSWPQYEIELVAREYERALAKHFPLTYGAFQVNRRVAP